MKNIIVITMLLLGTLTVVAKDIQTVIFTTTPPMHCEGCEKRIKSNLRFEKGVKQIETNIDKQTVTITFDADKTTVEKLAKGFEKIDYTVHVVQDGDQSKSQACQSCDTEHGD